MNVWRNWDQMPDGYRRVALEAARVLGKAVEDLTPDDLMLMRNLHLERAKRREDEARAHTRVLDIMRAHRYLDAGALISAINAGEYRASEEDVEALLLAGLTCRRTSRATCEQNVSNSRQWPLTDSLSGAISCVKSGGRYWVRTSDPLGVSEVL